jgi:hypothetical protein
VKHLRRRRENGVIFLRIPLQLYYRPQCVYTHIQQYYNVTQYIIIIIIIIRSVVNSSLWRTHTLRGQKRDTATNHFYRIFRVARRVINIEKTYDDDSAQCVCVCVYAHVTYTYARDRHIIIIIILFRRKRYFILYSFANGFWQNNWNARVAAADSPLLPCGRYAFSGASEINLCAAKRIDWTNNIVR